MTTDQDPRAWKIAIALAAECGLDWAKWARGAARECQRRACSDARNTDCPGGVSPPVTSPWDHEAYRADCARRGVEPGPMPALEWWAGGTGVCFKVEPDGSRVRIDIGAACWAVVCCDGRVSVTTNDDGCEAADFARLARLVTVAAEAMRPEGGTR